MPITEIGQRWTKVFPLVKAKLLATVPICDDGKFDCNYYSLVFADNTGDDLKNDKNSFFRQFQSWTTGCDFIIQKDINDVWTDMATITDDTYGEYYPLGTFTLQPYSTYFTIYWELVYNDINMGEGDYRIKMIETNQIGTETTYSYTYCLTTYNCDLADNTIRLEWYNNKIIGDVSDDKATVDFRDINLYNQYRVSSSFFGHPKSSYKEEFTEYSNGEIQKYKDEQEITYILKIGNTPAWVHDFIKNYMLQADNCFITDYSTNNPETIVQKQVKRKSGFEPKWINTSKCAPVTLEFTPKFNRLEVLQ